MKRSLWSEGKRCKCGNTTYWEIVSDAQTGTTYAECLECGRYHLVSPHGYVDWSTGVFMQGEQQMGSDWTQKTAKTYFAPRSGLTNGQR